MKLIRVASIAFVAYFVSSADGIDIDSIRFSRIVNRKNSSFSSSAVRLFSVPITIRPGFMKSSTAVPSFRNSGQKATSNSRSVRPRSATCSPTISFTRSVVPTAMKTKSARSIPSFRLVVKRSRPCDAFRLTISSSPGS